MKRFPENLKRCAVRWAGAAVFVLFALTLPAVSQLNGNTGTVTLTQAAFGAVGTIGPSSTFRNVGQGSHWLTYCTTNATAVQIAIEGSNDGSTWFQISNLGTATGCNVLSAGGYFQYVRADIYQLTGVGASVTATYTASTSPIAGNGILGGASTTKVSMIPGAGWASTTLSSSAATVTSSPAIVYSVHAYNPNAGVVYVELTDNGATSVLRAVPASSANDLTVAAGVLFNTNVQALCTTNATTPTAPASPCVVNVIYRGLTVVNSNVSTSGVVFGTQQEKPQP